MRVKNWMPAIAGVVVFAAAISCGNESGRSTAAFCREVSEVEELARSTGEEIQTHPDDDLLGGLALSIGALGEIPTMMRRLESSAPDEIHEDMTAVADVFADAYDPDRSLDNPLQALAGSFISGLMVQNQIERVDEFARQNCGSSIFGT